MPKKKSSKASGQANNNPNVRTGGEASGASTRGQGSRARRGGRGVTADTAASRRVALCWSWQETGTCQFGERCRFSHKGGKGKRMASTLQPEASEDVKQFLKGVVVAVQRRRWTLILDNPRDRELWMQSWSALAVGAEVKVGRSMLCALMRLPDSTAVAPARDDMVRALGKIAAYVADGRHVGNEAAVDTLELVADVIEHRLLLHEEQLQKGVRESSAETAAQIRTSAHGCLLRVISDARLAQRASRLLCRMLALLERYVKELESLDGRDGENGNDELDEQGSSAENENGHQLTSWVGWRAATLEWLQRGRWLDAAHLDRQYDSIESYANTVRQLMTMLTFYWGAGAVFPKCRHKSADDRWCDQPLCARIATESKKSCGRRRPNGQTCSALASWRCSRHGHDLICDRCLRHQQRALVGEPGPRASTDIYDAVVERETLRRDGVVYILSGLKSRKPPAINPNWRTTYRLNCSALVAVMRLGASCEPLMGNSRVEWAEVVAVNPQDGITDDFMERSKGRLALRLLTRADLSSLSNDPEALEAGMRLAVIDLQVFVPEVVSVLSTLADPTLVEHLNRIPFAPVLIGAAPAHVAATCNEDVKKAIIGALSQTELRLVTRLSATKRANLAEDLTELAVDANLSGTQLEAFTAALSSSLHCTQGPPGTGKSYIGVVLVRALDRIRSYAAQAGVAVGPIVVLSYKNHALDEILADVLASGDSNFKIPGHLIRCGRPENEDLASHAERFSPEESRAQKILSRRVACLRSARRSVRDFRSLRSAFSDETGFALEDWTLSRKNSGTARLGLETRLVVQALRLRVAMDALESEPSAAKAYALLEPLLETSIDMQANEDRAILKSISGLETDTEHWREELFMYRSVFLVDRWLSGTIPPPRCAAAQQDGGCLMVSSFPGGYCAELHDCRYPGGCNKRRAEGVLLCEIHRCEHNSDDNRKMCQLPRLEASEVCSSHACPRCVMLGCSPILARENAACEGHSCRSERCGAMYIAESIPFCPKHCCFICHHWASKVGSPEHIKSVQRVGASQFCREHKCIVNECRQRRLPEASPQDYCREHSCVACDGTRRRVDTACQQSRLCTEHRCSYVDPEGETCRSRRYSESLFCLSHTCFICRKNGLALDSTIVDQAPRNVCSLHPLCVYVSHIGIQCNDRICDVSHEYCDRHVRPNFHAGPATGASAMRIQCSGTTTKGKRCKTRGQVLQVLDDHVFYCGPHLDQKPESSSESDDAEDNCEDILSEVDGVHDDLACSGEDFDEDMDEPINSPMLVETKVEELDTDHPKTTVPGTEIPHLDGPGNESKMESPGKVQDVRDIEPVEEDKLNICEETTGAVEDCADAALLRPDESSKERASFGICPDEVDIDSAESNSSDGEMPEHFQHLRDIIGADSTSGSDSEDAEVADTPIDSDVTEDSGGNVAEWVWAQAQPERLRYIAKFLGGICVLVAKLAMLADGHVEIARRERAEAAAYSFKRARLIGATVVGATKRLHAIRASEPFAMVVEEACEVLEPTLLSVLSVRSLRKLELIGDHRQLPAFVQPCWFSLQTTHPSIKVSLFERLVENDKSACTVLDVQRRMRPEICDLTRFEYADVVQIKDHPSTISQRVADRQLVPKSRSRNDYHAQKLSAERQLWRGEGIVVPGINAQVFFWDLKSEEGRPVAGLSRCNYGEAEACVALVNWLIQSGVRPVCITIITPFKGQKLTIVRELRKGPRANAKDVMVSTVDRYQGDENDIIILSLVCSRPGNRFVALRNRFIVSASRARIGFYIVGSSAAVAKSVRGGGGPSHWRRLLQDLEHRDPEDSENQDQIVVGHESRIGAKLTICCPRHDGVSQDISGPKDFPVNSEELSAFCSEPCSYKLPWCGHGCQRPCHSLELKHTNKCKIVVTRPCNVHVEEPLHCCDLQRADSASSHSLAEALAAYQCDVVVEYRRPECPHVIELRCHEREELSTGLFHPPQCAERVEDFVHPACGHVTSAPTCYNRRLWEDSTPACQKNVLHERACGCKARMSCNDSVQEASLDKPPVCLEAVLKPRPRCSHLLSSRCHEATMLSELWAEQDGEAISGSPLMVTHGVCYGPSETELGSEGGSTDPYLLEKQFPACLINTTYRRSCGHTMPSRCSHAFELAAGAREEGLCQEITVFNSPICGHQISAFCNLKAFAESLSPTIFVTQKDLETSDMISIADEIAFENVLPFDAGLTKLGRLCRRNVTIVRNCGHKTNRLPCAQLHSLRDTKQLPKCKVLTSVKRSCGHTYDIRCYRRRDPPPICNEPLEDLFTFPSCRHGHSVRPGTCCRLAELRALADPNCPIPVKVVRSRCTHVVEVPCSLERNVTQILPGHHIKKDAESLVVEAAVNYCEPAMGIPDCHEPVLYRRLCGHEDIDIPCCRAFEWAACLEDEPQCQQPILVDSPLCQHSVQVPCCFKDSFLATNPWRDERPPRVVVHVDGDELTCPVVTQGEQVLFRPGDDVLSLLKCGHSTHFRRSCGHEEVVACEDMFAALESHCERLEHVQCQDCGHMKEVRCHEITKGTSSHLCTNLVQKKCSVCNVNKTSVMCFKEIASCKSEVHANLPCGHPAKWMCGEVDPRTKLDTEPCLHCLRQEWLNVKEAAQCFSNEQGKKTVQSRLLADSAQSNPRFDPVLLVSDLRNRARSILPPSWIKLCTELEFFDTERLLSAYLEILSLHIDLFSHALENESRDEVFSRTPPNVSDVTGSYDIVYDVLSTNNSSAQISFRPVNTQYGFGARANILTTEALFSDGKEAGQDGCISICVAAALRHQALEDSEPFRPEHRVIRRITGRKKFMSAFEKAETKARKLMQLYRSKGYDHACRQNVNEKPARVYWVSGAVVPLLLVKIQVRRTCEICLDDLQLSKGWHCAQDHFLCRDCFNEHVKQALAPNALARTVDGTGNILCPHDGCDTKFEPLLLLRQQHDATEKEMTELFEALEQVRMAAHTKREVSTALEQQKHQLQCEFQRIQAIEDLEQRRAETLRLDIVEQILNLRCPRRDCRVAFVDFDGCFALRCSNCRVHFCAWCIDHHSEPGGDVHGHVLNCTQATRRGYYHSFEVFREHHRKRRRELVIEKLRTEDRAVRQSALNYLEKELRDLDIRIEEFDFK